MTSWRGDPVLDPAILDEKLRPPRALTRAGKLLLGPPRPPSRRAWLAWLGADARDADAMDAVDRALALARAVDATTLAVGGPPGNYVLSGVDAADAAGCSLYERAGFTARGTHCDLVVRAAASEPSPGVTRCVHPDDEVLGWIATNFAPAWSEEAERALYHGGLFVARDGHGRLAGFVAHSGNNAAWGTFGPVGVAPDARGAGLGRALTRTALGDLAARGFERVTVPWVDIATVPFYAGIAPVLARTERVIYARDLT